MTSDARSPAFRIARALGQHPGSYAGTLHTPPEPKLNGTKRHLVAEYPGSFAGASYRVLHDPLAHQPYGLYRVYVADVLVGSQLSFPDADDCARMHRPARYQGDGRGYVFDPAGYSRAGKRGRARGGKGNAWRQRKAEADSISEADADEVCE